LGAHWQLLTASLQPVGWANLAATVAALATAGAYAERRMGSIMFTATYLAGGAMTSLAYYAASAVLEEGTAMAGAAAALLGPAATLAVFVAANWRVLGAAQRGHCALATGGLAAVALTELDLLTLVYALSAVAGAALGAAAGPQLQILRELDIKEGSMTISGLRRSSLWWWTGAQPRSGCSSAAPRACCLRGLLGWQKAQSHWPWKTASWTSCGPIGATQKCS
jgi:hypothetical protein